jgi:hypothetical protein
MSIFPEVVALVLSFGPTAKAIAPSELVHATRQALLDAAEQYEEHSSS